MDHQKLQEQLAALYDGELTGTDRALVQAHLDGCPDCQTIYSSWAQTAKALFPASSPAGSEFFVRRVMSRIEAIEESRSLARKGFSLSWLFPSQWLVPAASLAVLLLAVAPGMPQNMTIENVLFQDLREKSPWMVQTSAVTVDDTLQMILEGPQ